MSYKRLYFGSKYKKIIDDFKMLFDLDKIPEKTYQYAKDITIEVKRDSVVFFRIIITNKTEFFRLDIIDSYDDYDLIISNDIKQEGKNYKNIKKNDSRSLDIIHQGFSYLYYFVTPLLEKTLQDYQRKIF